MLDLFPHIYVGICYNILWQYVPLAGVQRWDAWTDIVKFPSTLTD